MNKLLAPLPFSQVGIFVIRLIVGALMIYHGMEIFYAAKMNPYLEWEVFKSSTGKTLIYAGKAAELIAGVLLFLGLFTRIASIILICTMAYIAFFVGEGRIWYQEQHPFLFVLLGFVFLFIGPTIYSLDHLIFRNKKV